MGDNKRGLIAGLIAGFGGLILVTIIILMIVSTIDNAKLLRATATASNVINESGWLNGTGYTLAYVDGWNREFSIVRVINSTSNLSIPSANYTLTSGGILQNLTNFVIGAAGVKITYTYIAPTAYEKSTTAMAGNFTKGINNVSEKIPTILLIGAVVLLFGVIILLLRQSQAMGFGGGKSGSL